MMGLDQTVVIFKPPPFIQLTIPSSPFLFQVCFHKQMKHYGKQTHMQVNLPLAFFLFFFILFYFYSRLLVNNINVTVHIQLIKQRNSSMQPQK